MKELMGARATMAFAAAVAAGCAPPLIMHLKGDLGSGKTTFARGFITSMGYSGKVKSPTFTLVEPYEFEGLRVFHFDLYRLNEPRELEYIGMRELVDEADVICLIEWPDKAADEVPAADLVIQLDHHGDSRTVQYLANSTKGQKIMRGL